MNPYGCLRVDREPFSNTPDPAFLSSTRQHATCLRELEIALRLRRGLCVVSGDIGTGKTTLCRSLVRELAASPETDLHLLLDPEFETSAEFLRVLLASLTRDQAVAPAAAPAIPTAPVEDVVPAAPGWADVDFAPEPLADGLIDAAAPAAQAAASAVAHTPTTWQLKEAIKLTLFRLAEEEQRLVVLIVDEGQKLTRENLEILRELLNYETNDCKLLQMVIFGQSELEPLLAAMPNLMDRITLHCTLVPLTLRETAAMIRHRIAVATTEGQPPHDLFRPLAILVLYLLSGGSPRKIVRLCHNAMLETVLRGKSHIGVFEALAARQPGDSLLRRSRTARAALGFVVTSVLVLLLWLSLGGVGPVLHGTPPGGTLALASGADAASPHRDSAPTLQAEGEPTPSVPVGVTLLPNAGADARFDGPLAGLTLAPETEGPSLRATVTPGAPSVVPERAVSPNANAQEPPVTRPDRTTVPKATPTAQPQV